MNHDKRRGSFSGRTSWASHFMGLPWSFSGAPYSFSLPKSFVQRIRAAHIPVERGRAVWLGLRVELVGVLLIEPTSLDRGEGLVFGLLCVVEGAEEGRW
jgi:hypothetical protein